MKKLLFIYMLLIGAFLSYVYFGYLKSEEAQNTAPRGLSGQIEEKYVMVTFLSGIDYWKNVLKGFEDAAGVLGVSVEYRGAAQYDVHEQVTVMEQVIARKPAGIAVTAINSDALTDVINKAVDAGIPVVTFDSGAPRSKAYSFLGTDNYQAGIRAAAKMAELTGGSGQIGIITLPNQLNHQQRVLGFKDELSRMYPKLTIVNVLDGKGDQLESQHRAAELMNEYAELAGIFVTEANGGVGVGNAIIRSGKEGAVKVISFDTDKGTLDMVRSGVISATMAQGTWNMGYWSLLHLFHLRNDLTSPSADWRAAKVPPLPPSVDTGISVVTKSNVDNFYAK